MKVTQRQLDIEAFQVFASENQSDQTGALSPTTGTISVKTNKTNHNQLAKTKTKWDSLSSHERSDFIARVAAEKSLKEFLKSD